MPEELDEALNVANTWEVAVYFGGVSNVYAHTAAKTSTKVTMTEMRCLRIIRSRSLMVTPPSDDAAEASDGI